MEPTPTFVSGLRRAGQGVLVATAGVVLAWALARPQLSVPIASTRMLADGAAVVVLGLAVLPYLDVARYRTELATRRSPALATAAWLWLAAELVRLITAAAATAAVDIGDLAVGTTLQYATATVAGRTDLITVLCAAAVGAAAIAARGAVASATITGIAALGLAARTLSGHLSESPLGGVAVTLHVLAAAVWCGLLAAMLLTVRHRGQWARLLPRFSMLSLWCVLVLIAGGIVSAAAAVPLDSPSALVATGYGRLLLAKVAVTAALMVLAWRNRRSWVPSARGHRVSAEGSSRRSGIELALMAVALMLAAALAVTG
ncbi:putative copper resistance protein D [Arthrobacter sp. SLBN-53]|nr:putative copper resistance protein D [Arthrobacter sp. SLBN-53]